MAGTDITLAAMSVSAITYDRRMGRWQPDAVGRLSVAALELFAERGYDETTVAEIAERAGLSERTFFRHFADKREVLFGGASELQLKMVAAVAAAPAELPPIEAAALGVQTAGEMLGERPDLARKRSGVISANAELQERELIKMASMTAAFAETLRERGVAEPAVSLTAEAAIMVFRVSFERWVADGGEFTEVIADSFDQLRTVTGAR
jgi:AcrR family transcriptional regulator